MNIIFIMKKMYNKKHSAIKKALATSKPLLISKEKVRRLNTLKEYKKILKKYIMIDVYARRYIKW